MDNTPPSTSVLTSSCYSIEFQVLLLLQPLPCFALRPELFCSRSFSTNSNTCIKALAEYEGRSTSHLGILFLCLDISKGDGLEGKYLCWRKMKNVSHRPENRLRLFLENKLQSSLLYCYLFIICFLETQKKILISNHSHFVNSVKASWVEEL